MAYVDQLTTVPANSKVYEVYALDQPKEMGGKETHIGSLVLEGGFVKSKWGDEALFIRHQRSDEDVKLKPEWDRYMAKYSKSNNGLGECPFKNLGLF